MEEERGKRKAGIWLQVGLLLVVVVYVFIY